MRINYSPKLSQLTTLHLGGTAIAEIILENNHDAELLEEKLKQLGGQAVCIGQGSNLLALDDNLALTLIRPLGYNSIETIYEDAERALVKVGASVRMPAFLRFCLKNGLSGLEGLCGIPGSIGGAIAMNAGSFGVETASCLHNVLAVTDGKIKNYKISDLDVSYRKIKFPKENLKTVILEATFILTKLIKSVIFSRMSHNFFKKKSRQPLTSWSAGCAFKNPADNLAAGKLLEMAGFRGKKLGGMAFSAQHANFLINEGRGTSRAAMDLLEEASATVNKKFGIELEREVKVIPWP